MMETKSIQLKQSGACQLEAVVLTLGVVDSDGDLVERGAFGEQHVPFLWSHNHSMLPLGKARVFERGNDVVAEVEVLDTATCDWLKLDFATGPRQEYSIGFVIPEGGSTVERLDDGSRVRVISAIDLLEISGVVRGAARDTRTVGVKEEKSCDCGCGGDCEQSERERMELEIATLDAVIGYKRMQVAELRKWSYVDAGPYTDRWGLKCAERAARDLGIPVPKMRRLRRASWLKCDVPTFKLGRSIRGAHSEGVVYIVDGLDAADTTETVGHEVAHYAEFRKNRRTGEEFAKMYGEIFAATWAPGAAA